MTATRIRHNGDTNHPLYPHGKYAGYKSGCKCSMCVEGYRLHCREKMRRLRNADPKYREHDAAKKSEYRKTPLGIAAYRSSNRKRKQRVSCAGNGILIREIYLKCPNGYEVDHIIPLSKGGMHHEDNLQYLPLNVNRQKSAKTDFDCSAFAIDWRSVVTQTFNDYPVRE